MAASSVESERPHDAGGRPIPKAEARKRGPLHIKPADTAPRRESATAKDASEIVVFFARREGCCAECRTDFFRGDMIRVENGQPLCLHCADLDHLSFLARGDPALTRRAAKHSPLRAVVVEFSRTRGRYERQGVLVTAAAIEQAEAECLVDADRRTHQRERAAVIRDEQESAYLAEFAKAILAQFPGCLPDEARHIAAWAGRKHSGRVGRSAAAKQLDPVALRLAVVAHIRHEHTRYDALLMTGCDREAARRAVRTEIDAVLARWERSGPQ